MKKGISKLEISCYSLLMYKNIRLIYYFILKLNTVGFKDFSKTLFNRSEICNQLWFWAFLICFCLNKKHHFLLRVVHWNNQMVYRCNRSVYIFLSFVKLSSEAESFVFVTANGYIFIILEKSINIIRICVTLYSFRLYYSFTANQVDASSQSDSSIHLSSGPFKAPEWFPGLKNQYRKILPLI